VALGLSTVLGLATPNAFAGEQNPSAAAAAPAVQAATSNVSLSQYPKHSLQTIVDYQVIDQPLGDVVETLGKLAGIEVVGAAALTGNVRNWRAEGPLEKSLTALVSDQNLYALGDGLRLYVYPREQLAIKVLPLGKSGPATLRRKLASTFPYLPPGAVAINRAARTVTIIGPDHLAEAVAKMLTVPVVPPREIEVVRYGVISPR